MSGAHRVQRNVLDPQGQLQRTRQWLYDQANRLQKVLGANGQTTTYGYDANQQCQVVTTRSFGQPATFTTDSIACTPRRTRRMELPPSPTTRRTGSLRSRTAQTHHDLHVRRLGNLTHKHRPTPGPRLSPTTRGQRRHADRCPGTTTTYVHDALTRVLSATVADGTVTYEYDNTARAPVRERHG